jgi:hypothetical protein
MPIDASIILQQKPMDFGIMSPAELQAQRLKLAVLGNQSTLQQQSIDQGQFETEQRQRSLAQMKALEDLLAKNPNATDAEIINTGGITQGGAYLQKRLESEKTQADIFQKTAQGNKALGEASKTAADQQTARLDHIGRLAQNVLDTPEPLQPAAWEQTRKYAIQNGWADEQSLPAEWNSDTANLLRNFQQQAISAKDQVELKERIAQNVAEREHWTTQDKLRAQEIGKLNSPAQLAMQAAKGDKDAANALKILEAQSIRERQASNPVINLSLPAQQMLAQKTLETGVAPTFGRGAAGQTQASIYNLAAQKDPNANLAANSANLKADQESLKNLQKQADSLHAYGGKFMKNLDQFEAITKEMRNSGIPYVNMPVRMLDEKLLGKDIYGAFNVARTVAATEGGRVLTGGGNLGGVVSDSARHEIETLLDKNATLGQWLSAIKQLRIDYNNAESAMNHQLDTIKGRMTHSGQQQPSAAAGKADYTFHPDTGLQRAH